MAYTRFSYCLARKRFVFGFVAALILMAGPLAMAPRMTLAQDADQIVPRTETEYFAETGHNLSDPFLRPWQEAGGEGMLGIPLSEERYEEGAGGILQTFETMTLIYNPELAAPWDIQGQHLPQTIRREQAPSAAREKVTGCSSSSSCRFFPETGHTISSDIASFWEANGDLAILGMPVSESFRDPDDRDVTVQLFERAILEDHGSNEVKLRPIGRMQAEADGLIGADPAFLPTPPTAGTARLVHATDGLRMRSGPSLDDEILAVLPDSAEFVAVPDNDGDWIPGYADGYSGWVSADYLKDAPPLPKLDRDDWNPEVWQGAALSETNVRSGPTTESEIVRVLQFGEAVTVSKWVKGEEVFEGADMWAQISNNEYIYSRNVGRNAPVEPPPLPSDAPSSGRWIDVDLTQQLMTAFEGRDPLRTVSTTTGMAGWETPPGHYQILARVANETMTSGAIGAEQHYKLEDVLFTQYFSDRGHAIHFAWWRTPETIGRPGSHGCLNLLLDDAMFFWDWAEIGTPLYVHP
ncbi:MAG: L,D-transpeptidase family protein [Thermomicrobiales bacterium]